MKTSYIARTPAQAQRILDPAASKCLAELIKKAASTSEVAAACQFSLKQTHHHLSRLMDEGLIEIVEQRPRAGRAIKVYRAAAQEFHIPFALTAAADLSDLMRQLAKPLLDDHFRIVGQVIAQQSRGNLVLRANAEGGLVVTLSDLKNYVESAVSSLFLEYRLTPSAAKELMQRLEELQKWLYAESKKVQPHKRTYTLGLLLTPDET